MIDTIAALTTAHILIAIPDETTVIYLKFDKPFMFIIRDKENDEVWFTGTVYEPILWDSVKGSY